MFVEAGMAWYGMGMDKGLGTGAGTGTGTGRSGHAILQQLICQVLPLRIQHILGLLAVF